MQELTTAERVAIKLAKTKLGYRWKATIRLAWENGNYPPQVQTIAPHLQSIRNKIGPSGLDKIK